jgi:hypothetical protein
MHLWDRGMTDLLVLQSLHGIDRLFVLGKQVTVVSRIAPYLDCTISDPAVNPGLIDPDQASHLR